MVRHMQTTTATQLHVRRVQNIRDRREAIAEVRRRFDVGSRDGLGQAWDLRTFEPQITYLLMSESMGSDLVVYGMKDGSEIAVDKVHGRCAVTITPAGL